MNEYFAGNMTRDPRVRSYINPVRLVWSNNNGVSEPEALILGAGDTFSMRHAHGTEPSAILLDFGAELHGGIKIDSICNSMENNPVRFRVRFGESVSEAMYEPNNDHAIHDQEVLVPGMGYTEVGCTGFRFVRLDLLDDDVEVKLRAVKAVAIYHDLDYLGSFECSDERLNQIWKVGANTVHLCMQDYLWDGIKRDRLVWIGDIHPETRVVSTVFGKTDVVQKSLDYVRDQCPLPGWINGISSYSMWWIITQRDWYLYHGDKEYLSQQKDYLLGLLDQIMLRTDDSGTEKLDGLRFLDWTTANDSDAVSMGLQALLVLGLKAGYELCVALGENETAARVEKLAKLAITPREIVSNRKQPWALMALAGIIDAENANSSVLAVDPCVDMSTFYGYYVLEARAKAGDYSGCLQLMRDYWGKMIDLGATTFWEHFDIEWAQNAGRIDELVDPGMRDIHRDCGDYCYKGLRHSFCHGWAAGPTAWLSKYVLGVSPAAPGFQVTHINPHLGDLKWAKGKVPTPFGQIEVSHEVCKDGTIKTDYVLPDGVQKSAQ